MQTVCTRRSFSSPSAPENEANYKHAQKMLNMGHLGDKYHCKNLGAKEGVGHSLEGSVFHELRVHRSSKFLFHMQNFQCQNDSG